MNHCKLFEDVIGLLLFLSKKTKGFKEIILTELVIVIFFF